MIPSDAVRKGKRSGWTASQEAHKEGSSCVDVTPKRPHKRQRIHKRSRKPDPFQSSTTGQTSSVSSLLSHQTAQFRKKLTFSSSAEVVGVLQ